MKLSFVAITAIIGLVSASPVAVDSAPLEKRADKFCKTLQSKSWTPCYTNPTQNTVGPITTQLPADYAFWADCRKAWKTPTGGEWILVKNLKCYVSSAYVAPNDGSSRFCTDNLDTSASC
ncbi:hypothetical protein BJ508DRAFT_411016 [Ascobolus immersus RN42]|uniref:Uncharacterized protein n=1 Tax=Ascobolus immersus RN42 TaxID=1160509 RepID=A0A3N4IRJ1_ASCIM|nr:hypothetical protein BJ508DRAFT_411016 [Ascobolus immersus RN42]